MKSHAILVAVLVVFTIFMSNVATPYYDAPKIPKSPRWRYRPLIAGLKIAVPTRDYKHEVAGSIGFPSNYIMRIGNWTRCYYGFITARHLVDDNTYILVFQNTSSTLANYVGHASTLLPSIDYMDFMFVIMGTYNCSLTNYWNASRILPRLWYNYTSTSYSYAFIGGLLDLNSMNHIRVILGSTILKTGQRTYTSYGTITQIFSHTINYKGHIITLIVFKTDLRATFGDSGGFAGQFFTSAGIKLYGMVYGGYHYGNTYITYIVYHNFTNIPSIVYNNALSMIPVICNCPYTEPC